MYNLLLGWAAFVGVAVFVLYLRDPYAVGKHRSRFEAVNRRLGNRMRALCNNLRSRGLCPMA